ncbi:arylsulfatase [Thermopirellula anaerolimosa]
MRSMVWGTYATWMLIGLAALPVNLATAENHPNVVVILADDQGWGDFRIQGNTNLETPNLDSLAQQGARVERFYVCPVCSPTRAEFLTGRYHPRVGVRDVTRGGERLNLDEYTVAQAFQSAGYATGLFGKWHNGTQYPYHPLARGFQEYYGFTSGHWGIYFEPPLEHNGEWVRGTGYITDDLTDHAIRFIEKNGDRPFFCHVAYNTPHSPFQVPDRFYDKFRDRPIEMRHSGPEPENIEVTRAALAMCENIDWNVGRLLEAIEKRGISRDTIVIYFSDNGPNSFRWNGGFRGRKGSTDEGGVRSACFIRRPGVIPPGHKVTQVAAAIDLFPTLVDLTGISCRCPKPWDGMSLAPWLLGNRDDTVDRKIFSHWNGRVSVHTQRFILDHQGRLYDLESDPGQKLPVQSQFPEVAAELSRAVEAWRREVMPSSPDDRPFPVGYREYPTTYLPARDGVPSGEIRRSAQAPNCSFFTHWKSLSDTMTWNVEVHTPGEYEAVLLYTCPAADVGSVVKVSLGASQVTATITEPFDPPLRGAEFDRVPRSGESYVKDFKPLVLGTLRLSTGQGTLTLQAEKIAGQQVADVRAVVLRLLP